MKIGLIIPANKWFCPFVNIYTKILENNNIQYDIISWNRDGEERPEGIQFNFHCSKNRIGKLLSYMAFAKFVKSQVLLNKYDKLIVFSSQVGIFIRNFLKHYYSKSYIFDYRDLSIEQNKLFKPLFNKVLSNSFANIISSPGFKEFLPRNFEYIISHNLDITKALKRISVNDEKRIIKASSKIKVLTIGGIRDFSSNVEIIKALANDSRFEVFFVGKGPESEHLKQFVVENKIRNVFFHGYYNKEEEADFIDKADFMNIYYPKIHTHRTALSNRFYTSLIYNKPMIVTSGGIQGQYVERYNLGLSIENCVDIDKKLEAYLLSESMDDFAKNAKLILYEFVHDYNVFESKVLEFIRE